MKGKDAVGRLWSGRQGRQDGREAILDNDEDRRGAEGDRD
jgi:hypothetical protein